MSVSRFGLQTFFYINNLEIPVNMRIVPENILKCFSFRCRAICAAANSPIYRESICKIPHIIGTSMPLLPAIPAVIPTMKQSIDMAKPIKQASLLSILWELSLSHSTGSLLRNALASIYNPRPPSSAAPMIRPSISEMTLIRTLPKHTAMLVTAKDMTHIINLALKGVFIPEKLHDAPMLRASRLAAELNRNISVNPTFSPRSAFDVLSIIICRPIFLVRRVFRRLFEHQQKYCQ